MDLSGLWQMRLLFKWNATCDTQLHIPVQNCLEQGGRYI
jgi:hypothetical protein